MQPLQLLEGRAMPARARMFDRSPAVGNLQGLSRNVINRNYVFSTEASNIGYTELAKDRFISLGGHRRETRVSVRWTFPAVRRRSHDHSSTIYLRASRISHKPNRVKIARTNVV